jgi:hypothetical protein
MLERERIDFSAYVAKRYGVQIGHDSEILPMLKMIYDMEKNIIESIEKSKKKFVENEKPPILTLKDIFYLIVTSMSVSIIILITAYFIKKI